MGKTSVGLVFRSQAVEAVTLKQTFRRVTLGRCAHVNIVTETPGQPESPSQQVGQAMREALAADHQVVQAIREALAACQVKGKERVVVSVPARDVLLRCFALPMLPKSEWEQAIQFEARKYIPFKIEDLTWNYQVVEHRATKQLLVIFLGIRTDAFTRTRQWLRAAGIEPAMVEALSVSLTRAASLETKAAKDTFIGVVDIEQDMAHITILKDQVPYLSRDVSLGVGSELRSGQDSQVPVDRRAELLLSELRLSLEYFTHEHPYASIGKVLLFGDEYTIAPWCAWLSEQLRCPVELGTLAVEVPAGSPAVPLQFAAAIGLAMKGLQGDMKLDFLVQGKTAALPTGQRASVLSKSSLEFLRGLSKPLAIQAGLAALCLLVAAWIGNRHILATKSQLAQVVQPDQEAGWGLEGKTLEDLQAFQRQAESQLAFLRSTVAQRVSVAEKLDALAKRMPDGVWLEGLNYTNRLNNLESRQLSLNLRGACLLPESEQELEVISAFVQQIKQDPGFFRGFASAQLGEIASMEDPWQQYSYRTFRLNCQTEAKLF